MCVEKNSWLGVTSFITVLLAASTAAAATEAPQTSSTDSSANSESASFYLSASLNEGVSTLSNSNALGSNGTQTEMMLLGSLVLPNWIFEGGGGWFSNTLNGQAASSLAGLQSYSLSTEGGVAEISPQYRLTDHLQIGPLAELLFGTDVSFGAAIGTGVQDMTLLGGAQALYEFRIGATSLKLGARYLASMDLPGEMLQSVQATVQFGLPIF